MFEIERIAKAVGGDGKGFEIERIADALESGSGSTTGGGVEYVSMTSEDTDTLVGDFTYKYVTDAVAANKQLIFICNTVFLYIGQITASPDKVYIYSVDIDAFDVFEGGEDSTTHKMVFTRMAQQN